MGSENKKKEEKNVKENQMSINWERRFEEDHKNILLISCNPINCVLLLLYLSSIFLKCLLYSMIFYFV